MSLKNSKEQLKKYLSDVFFETGTYLGHTSRSAVEVGFPRVITVELQKYLYDSAIEQSKNYEIEFHLGDSPSVMRNVLPDVKGKITFWLDAHIDGGNKNSSTPNIRECPLYEELDVIAALDRKDHTILIDDLRIIGKYGWGSSTILEVLKSKILQINPDYNFSTIDGEIENDVLVAQIISKS
jgi:hypothetical protein